ncbi:MAG: peptide deformylase [Candidatus Colwellbacteria bacterium]
MKILIHPDRRLKRVAQPVDFEKMSMQERTNIVRHMAIALGGATYGQKIGLAAPQIGINYRVVIVRGNVMFNPTWTPSKAPANIITEGCYSVPNRFFKVSRATGGWAKWTNIEGEPMEDKINGLPAIVFQHELDHLDGKCCADVGEEIEQPSRTAEVKNIK